MSTEEHQPACEIEIRLPDGGASSRSELSPPTPGQRDALGMLCNRDTIGKTLTKTVRKSFFGDRGAAKRILGVAFLEILNTGGPKDSEEAKLRDIIVDHLNSVR